MTAFTVMLDDREVRELLANLALVEDKGGQAGGARVGMGVLPSGWWGMRQRGA